MIDLHVHSDQSDGTESPSEVVARAAAAGVITFALTDHDTTAGLAEAEQAASSHGVELVPGIELSATQDGRSAHVLGYFIDSGSSELQSLLTRMQGFRLSRAAEIVARLAEDYPIDWEEVVAQAESAASVGRPHIADVLVRRGVTADRPSAFATLLHDTSHYVVDLQAVSVPEAIKAIRIAGGVAVIAHPWGEARGPAAWTIDHFASWASAGLTGVEVWHREHSTVHRRMLLGIADRLGLLATGGSDYHGSGKPNVIGENTSSTHTLALLRALARTAELHG